MKTIIALSLLIPIFSSYAATEITYKEVLPLEAVRIGEVSFFQAGTATQSEVIDSLSKKTDAMGGTHFKVSSLNAENNTYATAIVYK
ncbi:DUF1471 domain-containing protein [Pectobacterium versatile]|uniref:DUF1471 domain-containing protein n=1 Tax=Pectobacterium versatile TaxID=2488639 RepID=UPI0032EBFA1D